MAEHTDISKVDKHGVITLEAIYVNNLSTKENLISFIEQRFNHNNNFWTYPKDMEGIREMVNGGSIIDVGDDTYVARVIKKEILDD